ncbi:hypothetical protein QNI16_18610 [Cytophagaceae bacterium YF14B1]|uniref:Uncharacterized protein n=1 Tax=Xanthocytophaga flava TaxID=3048013 RepID=A0AAE3U8C4_9BACT|nr:hypothetical protein [Xanthocytophaga flavus]MDJ1482522.1 hypothetical protein [Xanthocytophaga flavus]
MFISFDSDSVDGNPAASVFYELLTQHWQSAFSQKSNKIKLTIELSLEIDAIIRFHIFSYDILVKEWQANNSIEYQIKLAIGNLLFDAGAIHHLPFDYEKMDELIDACVAAAKIHYPAQPVES